MNLAGNQVVGVQRLPVVQPDPGGGGALDALPHHGAMGQQPVVAEEDAVLPLRVHGCAQGGGGVHERVLGLDQDDLGHVVEQGGHPGPAVPAADDDHPRCCHGADLLVRPVAPLAPVGHQGLIRPPRRGGTTGPRGREPGHAHGPVARRCG
jgi:hypothetical protein